MRFSSDLPGTNTFIAGYCDQNKVYKVSGLSLLIGLNGTILSSKKSAKKHSFYIFFLISRCEWLACGASAVKHLLKNQNFIFKLAKSSRFMKLKHNKSRRFCSTLWPRPAELKTVTLLFVQRVILKWSTRLPNPFFQFSKNFLQITCIWSCKQVSFAPCFAQRLLRRSTSRVTEHCYKIDLRISEVSMDRIRIGYPAGSLRFFWIKIGFGYLFLKKIGSGHLFDFYFTQRNFSITKFPWEWFKMSQMMVLVFS